MNNKVSLSGKTVTSTAIYNNFKYKLEETTKTLRLVEVFLGDEAVIGEVRGWKRNIIRIINKWFNDKDERERGYRLFLAIKVLNKINESHKTNKYLQVMKELTLEESIFWVWQYHSYNDKAVNAFRCIHMNN